jgi:hypothetical protein
MKRPSRYFVLAVAFGVVGLGFAVQAAQNLKINGQVASSDVRMIGGKAYVPVADVAKALGLKVAKVGGGYELSNEGGAGPLQAKGSGKIGQEIFSGKWRFQVIDFKRADTYAETRTKRPKTHKAESGQEFVVVNCRVKNGTKAKDELVFSRDWEGTNTSLTDSGEQAHQVFAFDVREDENAPIGCYFLPGAAIDFSIVFQVPKGTEVKDLIFTAMQYKFRSGYDQKKEPPHDFRVSLKG